MPRSRAAGLAVGCAALATVTALPVAIPAAVMSAILRGVAGSLAVPLGSASPGGADQLLTTGRPGTPMTCPGLTAARGFQLPIHAGIDLDCPAGTTVRAVAGGIVRTRDDRSGSCPFSGVPSAGYGLMVTIEVDGPEAVEQLYAHLSALAAEDGRRVETGAVIGYEGTTGCSTGPHLHFEVRTRGVAVNPCASLVEGYPTPAWHDAGCPLHLLR